MNPRFVRMRDAPAYLGMDREVFVAKVRPHLTVIPIGAQGIAFDRLDLDAWADEHKRRNGRPPKGGQQWPEKTKCQDSTSGRTATGRSTSVSEVLDLRAKAQGRKTTPKPSAAAEALGLLYELNPDIDVFNLTDAQIHDVMAITIANDVCNRMDLQLGQTYERLRHDPQKVQLFRKDVREYVQSEVRVVMEQLGGTGLDPKRLARNVLRSAMEVFAS